MLNQPSTKKRRLGTPGFWALVAVGTIVAVVVLAILVDSVVYYNKVHSGVSVAGIDLGGQTKTEATASLQAVIDKAQNAPITLTAGGKTWTLMPSDVGATMDVEGAVKAAMAVSREHNFFTDLGTRWNLYFGKRDLPLTGSIDTARSRSSTASTARWSTRPRWQRSFSLCS